MDGIDSLVVGHFGEENKGFKQVICFLVKIAAESQKAGKHNTCELYGSQKERSPYLIQEEIQSGARVYGNKDSD